MRHTTGACVLQYETDHDGFDCIVYSAREHYITLHLADPFGPKRLTGIISGNIAYSPNSNLGLGAFQSPRPTPYP